MDWVNLYALAVNEENAAGGRIVTAPTNGAAGIVPAVLRFYMRFSENPQSEDVRGYLLAAVKAINAAQLALRGDGSHYVSLDDVIKTMAETGRDMMEKYKETSKGGLAVNVVEC